MQKQQTQDSKTQNTMKPQHESESSSSVKKSLIEEPQSQHYATHLLLTSAGGRSSQSAPGQFSSLLTSPQLSHPANSSIRSQAALQMQRDFGNSYVQRVLQPKLTIGPPGDKYEREADQVAEQVMRMPNPNARTSIQSKEESKEKVHAKLLVDIITPVVQQHSAPAIEAPSITSDIEKSIRSLKGNGRPLSKRERFFFEPRFGEDFSDVRIHTSNKAQKTATNLNAQAYTIGNNIVFGKGKYVPGSEKGKKLLGHELVHVVQQSRSLGPRVQRFTAELDGNKVYVKLEKGDTDKDLDEILCSGIKDRKIADRERIDVTPCMPKGMIKAMRLGPYNCAQFVRFALRGETSPKAKEDVESIFTVALWEELLKTGYRIASIGFIDRKGKVKVARPISWKQLSPQMGDLVFMRGEILLKKGAKEPNPAGDNFSVTWDHVGFFVVRSREDFDYHLAKDGDENPIDVYHTGSSPKLEEGIASGAYVKGIPSLLTYLRAPEQEKETGEKPKTLVPLGVADPEAFLAKKRLLDAALDRDFEFIVSKLDEAHYSDSDEGQVIAILKKWGEERFTTMPDQYPNGGDYLDKMFRKLRTKTKDIGIIATQWTDYYSLIFNHFDRVNEIISIRDKYSRLFKGEGGLKELSFGSFFWEQVKEGKVRDQVYAYFQGLKEAGVGLAEGLYLILTDPGKVLEGIGSLPQTITVLWENREKLWNDFLNSKPEEQARVIGRIFGELEIIIATVGAGGGGRTATAAPQLAPAMEIAAMSRGGMAAARWGAGGAIRLDLGRLGIETTRLTALMSQTAELGVKGKEKAKSLEKQEKLASLSPEKAREVLSKTRAPKGVWDVYVYGLLDEAGNIFYYGISNWPRRRLLEHLRNSLKGWQINKMRVYITDKPMMQLEVLKLETDLIKTSKTWLLNDVQNTVKAAGYTAEEAAVSTYIPRIVKWIDLPLPR